MQTPIAAVYEVESYSVLNIQLIKKSTGSRKKRKNKGECWAKPKWFEVNTYFEQHTAGFIVQRKQRTTQEIQLKAKAQSTDEILNITNLAIVLDQG